MMILPQSMSYAIIAGLDVKYAAARRPCVYCCRTNASLFHLPRHRYVLYSSVLPLICYAFLGTSRQLGVGPVALVSLLVSVGLKGQLTVSPIPLPNTP